ncbi:MAG TPA: rRNA maturation RNase YbeY [Spirochaetota bacterium]|nr:rRNA maturation RNase YbeY [Spirochaetota bacterium]
MSRVDVFLEGDVALPFNKVTAAQVKKMILSGLKALDLGNVSVTFILCDNAVIREVNRNYRKKDYPTDVISFAYRDMPFPSADKVTESLGDVYLSLEKAEEQASEYKVSFRDEVLRLVVHALCHLAGYDHEKSKKEEKIMHAKEDEIISILKDK